MLSRVLEFYQVSAFTSVAMPPAWEKSVLDTLLHVRLFGLFITLNN